PCHTERYTHSIFSFSIGLLLGQTVVVRFRKRSGSVWKFLEGFLGLLQGFLTKLCFHCYSPLSLNSAFTILLNCLRVAARAASHAASRAAAPAAASAAAPAAASAAAHAASHAAASAAHATAHAA